MRHLLAKFRRPCLRLALLAAATVSVMLSPGELQAGVMLLPADGMQSAGCGCDESPSKDNHRALLQALVHADAQASPSAGMTGSLSSSGANGSSVSSSAVFIAELEFAPPALVSAVLGEGPLVFKSPPVFELLDPPRIVIG